jgi:hypothetical protein
MSSSRSASGGVSIAIVSIQRQLEQLA